MDRRVRRTRAGLQNALLRLMLKQNYDTLSVADICAEADVGRSAFYVHFSGKDDLLRQGYSRLEADITTIGDQKFESVSTRFFAHALAHRPLYRAMMHSQAATISTMVIRRILTAELTAELSVESPAGAPRELRAIVLVDLMVAVMRWCLDRDPPMQVERIENIYRELSVGIRRGD